MLTKEDGGAPTNPNPNVKRFPCLCIQQMPSWIRLNPEVHPAQEAFTPIELLAVVATMALLLVVLVLGSTWK